MGYFSNMMKSLHEMVKKKPQSGAIVKPSVFLDAYRQYAITGMDFDSLNELLTALDGGNYRRGLDLFVEMEERDPHLASVANTRRLALTGLPWEVMSTGDTLEDEADREFADKVAGYVRERFGKLPGLRRSLKHLATGIGRGMAVCELHWEKSELVDIVPVLRSRLVTDGQTPDLRIRTEENHVGVPAVPPKFVVHTPHSLSAHPFETSLSRTIAGYALIKHICLVSWMMYCERFGMPFRVVKYHKGAKEEDKQKAIDLLKEMGAFGFALMADNMQFELVESNARGTSPFEALMNYSDRKMAMAYLGGHLTVDTTNATGTHAAGDVQNEVRKDIREEDIENESCTVVEQIIAPMVAYKFPDDLDKIAMPTFQRRIPENFDRIVEAQKIQAAVRLGIEVPKAWAQKQLGIPERKDDEEIIEIDPFAATEEGTEPANRFADKEL